MYQSRHRQAELPVDVAVPVLALFVAACFIGNLARTLGITWMSAFWLSYGVMLSIFLIGFAVVIRVRDSQSLISLETTWFLPAAVLWRSIFPALHDIAAAANPVIFEISEKSNTPVPSEFMPWWAADSTQITGFVIIALISAWQLFQWHRAN